MLSFKIKSALRSLTTFNVRRIANQPPPTFSTEQDAKPIVELPPFTEEQQKKILNAINKNNLQQLTWLYI